MRIIQLCGDCSVGVAYDDWSAFDDEYDATINAFLESTPFLSHAGESTMAEMIRCPCCGRDEMAANEFTPYPED